MRRFLYVVSLIALATATAQATVIDDFSADSSSQYSTLGFFIDSGSPASYGRNIADQFAPIINGYTTTGWLRNDGYTFNVGDTISIEVDALTAQTGGLALCPSLTDTTGEREYYVQWRPGGIYWLDSPGSTSNAVSDLSFAEGPATVALKRISNTSAECTWTYYKTGGGTATVTRTDNGLSAGTYYFGMTSFDAGLSGAVMDNLSYTAVPEPSAIVILTFGFFGLLCYAWQRRK